MCFLDMCCATVLDDVGVFMAAAGALLGAATVYLSWLSYSISSWPQVPGTVTISKAKQITGDDGNSFTLRELRYTYEVSRRRYVSSRVRFGFGSWHWSRAYQAHAERLAVGQVVTVWHHPWWPRLCTLQPWGTPGATALILAWMAYGVVAVAQRM